MWGFISLRDFLDVVLVPFVLAGLAVVASLITQRLQNKRRDLEIKTNLVSEISESVMSSIMAVHLFNTLEDERQRETDINKQQDELNEIYKKWIVNSCIIGSKLHAYFPKKEKDNKKLRKQWDEFKEKLTKFIKRNTDISHKKNEEGLEVEEESLFKQKEGIIVEILVSKITGFHYRPPAND
jgi:predicted nuclease with TOPRIM domain